MNNDKRNFIPVPQNVNESGNDNEQETDDNIPVQQNINLQKDDLPLQKFVPVQPDIVIPDKNNDMVNNMNKFSQPINPNIINIPMIPNKINIDPNQVSTPFNMNDTMNKPILQNTIEQNKINTPIIINPADTQPFMNNTMNKPIIHNQMNNTFNKPATQKPINTLNQPVLPSNPQVINNTVSKPILTNTLNITNNTVKNIQNTITDDNDVVKDGGFLSDLKSLKPKLKEIVKPVSGLFSNVKNKVINKFPSLFAKN